VTPPTAVANADGAVQSNATAAARAGTTAVEQGASIGAEAYAATFALPGKPSVPGDGAAHSFRIASRQAPQAILAKVKPSASEAAYVEAHVVNAEEFPLPAGEVFLFRDGAFSGTARIETVAPGEAFDLGFGADDAVKVKRIPVEPRKTEGQGLDQSTKTVDYKTTVKNRHDFRVVVVDRIPVSENEEVRVETLDRTTPPNATE
jgi:uncharacterized protein (TIGR02231 family)